MKTNIYSYLEISGGQNSNLYLNVVHFLSLVLIMHLWQLKTTVFLHRCQICAVLLGIDKINWCYAQNIFPASFASLGILNKDPTVWLGGARSPPVSFKVYLHSGENHTMLVHLKEQKKIFCSNKTH